MKIAEAPDVVPLPEVPEYTDEVVFSNLGLPIGFDEECLQVNLRAFQQVRTAAGLGQISITGTRGEAGRQEMSVSGIGLSGAATLAAIGKRRRNQLTQGTVMFSSNDVFVGEPDAVVRINRAEYDARLAETDQYTQKTLHPEKQANALNKAVKTGLLQVSRDANVSCEKMLLSTALYGALPATVAGVQGELPEYVPAGVLAFGSAAMLASAVVHQALQKDAKGMFERFRASMFLGCAPDRLLVAAGVIATRSFIKAA